MNERTHLDLFSGIGGFALAARANGVRTIAFCECDPRCQAFLAKAWPGVPVWNDVRSLAYKPRRGCKVESSKGESRIEPSTCNPNAASSMAESQRAERWQETKGRNEHDRTDTGREEASSGPSQCFGDVWLITGGVPCQPASRAGKQRGKEDDRWLWPDAIRVIAAVRPTWALLENPPGIGDVGLAGILAEVEAEGYEVRVFSIPACAVARRTEGNDTGLFAGESESAWPTPRMRDTKDTGDGDWAMERPNGKSRTDQLPHALKASWATPKRSLESGGPDPYIKDRAKSGGEATHTQLGYGTPLSGCLARTEKFAVRLMTLSAWLMGYTAAYLAPWATASSRKSRPKSSQP